MPLVNIEHIDGIRIVLPQTIRAYLNTPVKDLSSIEKTFYFFLNSSDEVVGRLVANNRHIVNEALINSISNQLKNFIEKKQSCWILDNAGSGKTTLLTQLAFNFSQQNYPVAILNAAILNKNADIEYLAKLRNYFAIDKPLYLFVDNAGACYETINYYLELLNNDKSGLNCHMVLFERTQRYFELPNRSELKVGKDDMKIEIDSALHLSFKEKVIQKFCSVAALNEGQINTAKKILTHQSHLSVSEQIIFLRRELPSHFELKWKTDWDEFEEMAMEFDWLSLHKLYSYVAILDQFGVPVSLSLLERLIPKLNKNEFSQFKKMLKSKKTQLLPFILEAGNYIRTNHELIAEWYADTHLATVYKDYLADFMLRTDTEKEEEKKLCFNVCSKKSVHAKYLMHFSKDFGQLLNRNEIKNDNYKNGILLRLMANDKFKNKEIEEARKYYEQCIAIAPLGRPVYMEWANHEEQNNNLKKAVIVLKRLLYNNPESVNRAARKKIVEYYVNMKEYARAKDFLFANEKLLLTDKRYEEFWTLFIKIYHQFVRLELWLTEEVESFRLKILYLSERHYKIYRAYLDNKDWENAKNHLLCAVRIKPNDEFFIEELKKIYARMGKSPQDISRIIEAILYHPLNLSMIKKTERNKGEVKGITEKPV